MGMFPYECPSCGGGEVTCKYVHTREMDDLRKDIQDLQTKIEQYNTTRKLKFMNDLKRTCRKHDVDVELFMSVVDKSFNDQIKELEDKRDSKQLELQRYEENDGHCEDGGQTCWEDDIVIKPLFWGKNKKPLPKGIPTTIQDTYDSYGRAATPITIDDKKYVFVDIARYDAMWIKENHIFAKFYCASCYPDDE